MRRLRKLFRKDTDLGEVVNLAGIVLVLRGLGSLTGLGVGVLVARLLGAEGAGLYFFAVSVVNIGSVFGRVGFSAVMVRNIAESVATKDWGRGRFVYSAGLKVVAGVSLIVGAVIFASAPWSATAVFKKPEYVVPLMFAALAIAPYSLSWMEGDALRALRRIPSAQLTKAVLGSLVTLVLLYPMARLWHADGAIAAFVLGTGAAAVAGYLLWRRAWPRIPGNTGGPPPPNSSVRSLLFSSWALLGVALANTGIQNIASIIIAAVGTTAEVGVFNVASRVSAMLLLPLHGVVAILAPKFVQLNVGGEDAALEVLVRRSFWLLLGVVAPAAVAVFLLAGPVMEMFGSHFQQGVPILRILLVSVVINVGTGPTSQLLMMCGRERALWKLSLATLVLAIGLCTLGQIFYGVIGLSWALVLAVVGQNVILVYLVRRHLGFWPIGLLPRRIAT